jgi:hypothetical protein
VIRRPRRLLCLAGIALAAAAAYRIAPGSGQALAYLSPALLLLLALAARRYPGERALVALMAAHAGTRRRGLSDRPPRVSGPRALLPRGGRLIAASLAVRPPPVLLRSL